MEEFFIHCENNINEPISDFIIDLPTHLHLDSLNWCVGVSSVSISNLQTADNTVNVPIFLSLPNLCGQCVFSGELTSVLQSFPFKNINYNFTENEIHYLKVRNQNYKFIVVHLLTESGRLLTNGLNGEKLNFTLKFIPLANIKYEKLH